MVLAVIVKVGSRNIFYRKENSIPDDIPTPTVSPVLGKGVRRSLEDNNFFRSELGLWASGPGHNMLGQLPTSNIPQASMVEVWTHPPSVTDFMELADWLFTK